MKRYARWSLGLVIMSIVACGDEVDPNAVDITDAVLTRTDAACTAYAGSYSSSVQDVGRSKSFVGRVTITDNGDHCELTSNSIPNHDFNDGARSFVNTTSEATKSFSIPSSPQEAAASTELSLRYDDGIFLNGVKLDLLAAACYGVGNEPAGQEKIGCFDTGGQPFRYDPMSPLNAFGTDSHNAHTQPDGEYHYHGDPKALHDPARSDSPSPVVGFAADGFPIFGPFFRDEDTGEVRRATSSYSLKSGVRAAQSHGGATYDPSGPGGAFEGEEYNGRFVDDYEYIAGSGDLDECNGMVVDGRYGYRITNTYPWVLGCFKGAADESFRK